MWTLEAEHNFTQQYTNRFFINSQFKTFEDLDHLKNNMLSEYLYKFFRGYDLDLPYYDGHNVLLNQRLKGLNSFRIVVPVSGGLDSYVALELIRYAYSNYGQIIKSVSSDVVTTAKRNILTNEPCYYDTDGCFSANYPNLSIEIIPVRIGYGHNYNEPEDCAVEQLGLKQDPSYIEMDLNYYQAAKNLVPALSINNGNIFARNQALASICAMLNPDVILLGNLADDMDYSVADCNRTFLHKLSDLTSHVLSKQVVVTTPFLGMTKSDLVAAALSIGITKEQLYKTYSCAHETHTNCGLCLCCYRRFVAFANNNIEQQMLESCHNDPRKQTHRYLAKRKTNLAYEELLAYITSKELNHE